jgi:hypothetical protein
MKQQQTNTNTHAKLLCCDPNSRFPVNQDVSKTPNQTVWSSLNITFLFDAIIIIL